MAVKFSNCFFWLKHFVEMLENKSFLPKFRMIILNIAKMHKSFVKKTGIECANSFFQKDWKIVIACNIEYKIMSHLGEETMLGAFLSKENWLRILLLIVIRSQNTFFFLKPKNTNSFYIKL